MSSLIVNGTALSGGNAWRVAAPFAVTFTALWGYGALHRPGGRWPEFGALSRHVGALGLCLLTYVLTFHEVADEAAFAGASGNLPREGYTRALAIPLAVLAVLLAAGVAGAACTRRSRDLSAWWMPLGACAALFVATLLPEPELYGTIAFNAIAAGLALYGIVKGLKDDIRLPYWSGLTYLVILIASRFFEYESHLIIKSLGFIGAGVILILAGIAFESRLRRRGAPTRPQPHTPGDAGGAAKIPAPAPPAAGPGGGGAP